MVADALIGGGGRGWRTLGGMDLYARVNILDQRAVRLPRGDVTEAIALDSDPVNRARGWQDKGVDFLHIVKARGEWKLFHVTWHGREDDGEATTGVADATSR